MTDGPNWYWWEQVGIAAKTMSNGKTHVAAGITYAEKAE